MESQILEFVLLDFSLALTKYSLTITLLLSFGMITYILCYCILEVFNFLFDFIGSCNYEFLCLEEETLDF